MTDTSPKSQEILNESISALVDGESTELDLARILKASQNQDAGASSDSVLEDFVQEDSVQGKWRRYNLAGDVLRGDAKSVLANMSVTPDFTAGVLAAIDAEENVSATAESSSSSVKRWTHSLGKVAIAASVTLAVLVGFQYLGEDQSLNNGVSTLVNQGSANQQSDPIENTVLPGATVPAGFELPSVSARTVSNVEEGYTNRFENNVSASKLPLRISPASSFAPGSEEEQELRARIKRMMRMHAEGTASGGVLGAYPYARATEAAGGNTSER